MKTMSREEAEKQAFRDILDGIVYDGVSGMASGIGTGLIMTGRQNAKAKKVLKEYGWENLDLEDVRTLVESGLESAQDTEAYELALELQELLDAGQMPSKTDIARQIQANNKAIRAEMDAESQAVGNAQQEYISMEDYANSESPVWNNVAYDDNETKAAITQQAHEDMVKAGAVVTVPSDVLEDIDQAMPDLRSMKKSERTPILKAAVKLIKDNLRQFLSGFSGQKFDFSVNGKILEAKLYSTGINEVLEKITKQKANMLYSTEDIFRNARYLYSTEDYGGDPNVYRWNYFYTPVQIGEDTVGVRIAVRDMVKGTDGANPESQIYNWGIKKDASLDGGSHGPKVASSDVSSDASNAIIDQGGGIVNNEQNGGNGNAESTESGNRVPTGGSQRNAGMGTGESGRGMDRRAGTAAGRASATNSGRAIAERRNLAQDLRRQGLIQPVSSKELGLSNGTDKQNIAVLHQEYWDEELQQIAKDVMEETGKEVTFIVGKLQVQFGKYVKEARGARTRESIIVQVDNTVATPKQIADHEIFHDKIHSDIWLIPRVREQVLASHTDAELAEVITRYAEALSATMTVSDKTDMDKLMWKIEEEIYADAYAGINYKSAGATRFTEPVRQYAQQENQRRGQWQENGVRQTNGPNAANKNTFEDDGVQYSLDDVAVPTREELESKPDVAVVDISKPQTKGTFAQRRKQILQNVEQVISKPYLNKDTGVMIFLTEQSYAHAFSNAGELQINAAEHMPELIENAVLTHAEPNTHGSDYATGAYTFFAAARAERVLPVKLKVKEYKYAGQDLPKNIKAFFENEPQGYAASYDTVVLELEEIEESPTGSAKDMDPKDPFQGPEELSIISVADLLNLVKGDAQKYIPSYDEAQYSMDEGEVSRIDGEMAAEMKKWESMYLENRLGKEGAAEYRAQKAQQEAQRKATAKAKDKDKRREQAEQRRRQKESRESAVDAAMNKKLAEGAKPTQAKRELRVALLDMFSIPAGSRTEIAELIDSMADRMIREGALTEELRKTFFDRLYASGAMTVPADTYMEIGREIVNKGRIYVDERVRAELGDDWNSFRCRAFGAGVYLTNDRADAGIDQWNHELADMLPGLFDSEETDLRSILDRIIQVAEEGRSEQVSLPEYTAQLAGEYEVSEEEVLDSMERDMDMALRVFARTAGMEIKLKEQGIRDRAALTKENMRQRIQMAQQRQERQEMARRQQEQKELREMQQRTLKALQWLSKNRWRAPEELKATFDEVLSDIDVYAVGAANEMRWSDKYGATWKDLAQMYLTAKDTDPNFMPSKELEMIVSRLNDQKIADMDLDALNDLYKAAVGLRTEFYNRNNVINDEMHRLFEEVYGESKAELEAAAGGYTGKLLDKLFNMEQLTAMNVLQRMAGWNPNSAFYSMAQQLERGERDVRAFTVEANRMLEEFLTEHEDWVKKADGQGKDAVWYTLEVPELLELGHGDKPIFGDTVTVYMTPAQKVHMYLESKNVDNLRHMMGGRTFVSKELYSKGERTEAFAQGTTIRLAPETVKQIVSDLTAEERELAQILEQYYNSFAKGKINRVSNVLYGYDKAMGKNYAPIFTNQNYVQSEIGKFDQTAEGVGNMKGRIPYSKNPSYNIGAFDAFERNVEQTARFVGMSIPARNWNTLLNWQENKNSMGDVISHEWGDESKKYIVDLLTELQGGKADKKDIATQGAEKLMSNYISSVFGANPGIVLKQLGSIPLAGVYLGGGNVPTLGQIRNIDRQLIAKYTQDLDWRSLGYSMPETKQLKDNPNWTQTNKAVKFVFGGGAITAMDTWAASTLWPWAENKVRKEHPELEMGTREMIDAGQSPFYRKVAEEFENAVARSQSTSDQMHQSSMRKSKSTMARMLTMFRSDSAQTYNALRQMIGEAQYAKKNGGSRADVQKAQRAVGTVLLSALANFLWAEGINFAMALVKNGGKYYRDDDDELTAESVAQEMLLGMFKSYAGIFVGGEELADIIGSVLTGEKWYEVEAMEVSLVQDLLSLGASALEGARDLIADGVNVAFNGGNVIEYFHRHGNDLLGKVKDAAVDIAGFLGIPAANVEAYLTGLLKMIPGFEAGYDDVFATATKGGLSGLSGKDLQVRVGNILSNRNVEASSDTEKTLAGLYEDGYTNVIPSDTPASVTVDGESHKLSAYQQQVYDKAWAAIVDAELEALVGSDVFREADPEKQEKMLKTLYSYAADEAKAELFEELEGSSRADDIAAFEEAGLEMADYLGAVADGHDPKKFLEAVGNGLSADQVDDLMDEVAELEPLEGEDQVADVQKWRQCVDMWSNSTSQLAALATYMTDSQIKKARTADLMDVNLSDYVKLYEIRAEYDANGNKSYSQAEYKTAIDSLKLSKSESAVLWQLATGAKSAKNNPYSTSIGERVLELMG